MDKLEDLKTRSLVSWCNKSKPSPGSPCYRVENLNWNLIVERFKKRVNHKDGTVSLYLDCAVLRFWNN